MKKIKEVNTDQRKLVFVKEFQYKVVLPDFISGQHTFNRIFKNSKLNLFRFFTGTQNQTYHPSYYADNKARHNNINQHQLC